MQDGIPLTNTPDRKKGLEDVGGHDHIQPMFGDRTIDRAYVQCSLWLQCNQVFTPLQLLQLDIMV